MSYTSSTRDVHEYNARKLLAALRRRDVSLPEAVLAAEQEWLRIQAMVPEQPDASSVRAAVLAGATREDLDALVLANLGHGMLSNGIRQAAIDAAGRVLIAIRSCADEVFDQLHALALVQIEQIEAAAAVDPASSMATLLRDGRTNDAAALAGVDLAVAEYDELRDLSWYCWEGGYLGAVVDSVDATNWADPRVASHFADYGGSRADVVVGVIRSGGVLHFPSQSEARAIAEPIAAKRHRDQAAAREKQLATHGFA